MKVLLLNPPARRKVFRDQYSSHTTKAAYYWQPMDLLLQSGILASAHDVEVLDCVAEGLSQAAARTRVLASKPQAIVALSSFLTAASDLHFLKACRDHLQCKIILQGDLFYFHPRLMLESEVVDAICLQYPSWGLLGYLNGETTACEDLAFKGADGKLHFGTLSKGPVSYPAPRHFAFNLRHYSVPLARYRPCFLVHTGLGCPFSCSYCTATATPFRERPLEDVFAELDFLKANGAREIWFRDFSFNGHAARAKTICRELIRRQYGFSWFAMTRPDRLDSELVDLMAEGGCHTITGGVDSADFEILAQTGRRSNLDRVREGFTLARSRGLLTMAHFIVGLPGETRRSAVDSIDFVCSLDVDYLSLNMFSPRVGTRYARKYGSLEEALQPQTELDSAAVSSSWCELSVSELAALKRRALARFYLRPGTIFRLLKGAGTWMHLQQSLITGARLLWQA